MKRLSDRHNCHRGAVRVRNNSLGNVLRLLRVHLGDNKRNLGILAPGGGIIHHGGTRLRKEWSVLLGGRTTRREQRDINSGEALYGLLRQILHNNLVLTESQFLACRTRGGEETDRVRREIALFQDGPHHAADLPGGTYNCNSGHDVNSLILSAFSSVRYQRRRWQSHRHPVGTSHAVRRQPSPGLPRG